MSESTGGVLSIVSNWQISLEQIKDQIQNKSVKRRKRKNMAWKMTFSTKLMRPEAEYLRRDLVRKNACKPITYIRWDYVDAVRKIQE